MDDLDLFDIFDLEETLSTNQSLERGGVDLDAHFVYSDGDRFSLDPRSNDLRQIENRKKDNNGEHEVHDIISDGQINGQNVKYNLK